MPKEEEKLTPAEEMAKNASLGDAIEATTSVIGKWARYALGGWRADIWRYSGPVPRPGGSLAPTAHAVRIPRPSQTAPPAREAPQAQEAQEAPAFAEVVGLPGAESPEDQGSEE